jgi:hypothetical protein
MKDTRQTTPFQCKANPFTRATIINLGNPEPDLLPDVARNILWPYLAVDCMLTRPNIGLSRTDEAWSLPKLPAKVKNEEDWNVDVGNKKVLDVKATNEGSKSVENNDNREVD